MSLTAPAGQAMAPAAPGRMGTAVEPSQAAAYLDALGRWRDERHRELEELDQAALSSPNGAAATSDIMLSMALWKAVSDRYELLLATWDSGRVGPTERMRLATLIWGRLDAATASGLSVSLPEACRLSDALVAQLRVRLGLEISGAETTERIRQLRAQMERIRDQVDLEPAGPGQQQAAAEQSRLARRLKEIADKAGRGGDVGGLLGPLETDAATFERDLIVNGARRRDAAALVGRAARAARRSGGPGGRAADAGRALRTPRRPGPPVRRAGRRRCWAGAEHRSPAGDLPAPAGPGVTGDDRGPERLRHGAGRARGAERPARRLPRQGAGHRGGRPRRAGPAYAAGPFGAGPARQPDDARRQLVSLYQTYLEMEVAMTACTQPGCTGTIVDGYCDVCGSPGPAATGHAAHGCPGARPGAASRPVAGVPSRAARAPSSTATATSAAPRPGRRSPPRGSGVPPGLDRAPRRGAGRRSRHRGTR